MSRIDLPAHIRALLRPDRYPHPVDRVRLLQTHASWVLLAGAFAYKFKKPVNFGFMDFSTLEKRHHFCQRELELNRRMAPSLYLDLLPIRRDGAHFGLGGDRGEIIDYCVKMRRFDQANLFDQKLEQGALNPEWLDRLASDVARLHVTADCAGSDFDHAGLLRAHLHDNLAVARAESTTATEQIARLDNWIENHLEQLQPALAERLEQRHIRRCHGDLHLRNIALIDGTPTLFDCIEFSDDYSIIDTMNDIAFLVMDCDASDRGDLGIRFLSRYLESSGDYQGLALIRLYLLYRATVRAKVALILADELSGEAKQPQWQLAQHYLDLALRYTQPMPPQLFAVGGLSGSGKSHLALTGCGSSRAIIIRSDATRQRIAADHPDLPRYGDAMHRLTYRAMFESARIALDSGWSVILDATFLHPDSRQSARQLADHCHVPIRFYWLDLPEALLRERIRSRISQGVDISDADLAVLDLQLAAYRRPDEPWITLLESSDRWPG